MSARRYSRLKATLLAVSLGAGCAGQQATYDYDNAVDFGKYRRWTWLPQSESKPSGDPRIDSPLMRQRIEAAVTRTLETRGYAKSEAQAADFDVGYLVMIENRVDTSGVSTSIGFGRSSGGSGVGISIGGPATRPREYEEGTLIIDVRDKDSGKLVWRGTSTRRLGRARTPEESEQIVNEIVEEILANFPPKRGA